MDIDSLSPSLPSNPTFTTVEGKNISVGVPTSNDPPLRVRPSVHPLVLASLAAVGAGGRQAAAITRRVVGRSAVFIRLRRTTCKSAIHKEGQSLGHFEPVELSQRV